MPEEYRRKIENEAKSWLQKNDINFDFHDYKKLGADEKVLQEAIDTFYRLEDSDIFRGNISIFEFEDHTEHRASQFLNYFDEDVLIQDFSNTANFLLCFGDYTQHDSGNEESRKDSQIVIIFI